jgi:hypothetical protein
LNLTISAGDGSYDFYPVYYPNHPEVNDFFALTTELQALKADFQSHGKINVNFGNGDNLFRVSYHTSQGAISDNGYAFIDYDVNLGNGNNLIDVSNSQGNNIFLLGSGNNVAYLGIGNNALTTGNGNNTVYAGYGGAISGDTTTINFGSGDDVFKAIYGTNIINGGDGNNYLEAGVAASDTFIFNTHFTLDTVLGFTSGADKLTFDMDVFSSYQDFLDRSTEVDGDIVAIAHDGSKLVMKGHAKADIQTTDVTFTGCGVAHNSTVINADGSDSTTYYDACNNILQIRQNFLDGTHEFFEFNTLGQTHASYSNVSDANWNLTAQHVYDANGVTIENLVYTTNAAGDAVTTRTNGQGQITEIRFNYTNGTHEFFEYNVAGQPFASYSNVSDANWNLTDQHIFDAAGFVFENLAWTTDALGDNLMTRTDGAGLLKEQRFDYVDGTHSFFEYNTPGQAYPSYVNNYNSSWGLVSTVVYDANGNVV